MNTSIQNCMVAQSGGPTVAINASLAGVIKGAAGCYGTVYGSVNGILGILNEHYLNLSEIMEADDNALERLIHTPAMYLGSCRFKLPDFMDDDSSYNYIFKQFEKLNIGAFFYIGGNDSMDTVLKLSEYAASALARNEYSDAPHLIYLPECNFDKDEFLTDVRALLEEHNNIIIAVSEGIHDAEGNYICAGESKEDTFGHSQLSGAGKALEYLIKDNINVKVRSVEVNVLQRCAAHLSSATDLNEAVASGEHAVAFAKQGITASMVTMNRTSNAPYTIEYGYAEIKNIANEAKSVPRAWINERGNDVTEEMVAYLLPLIQGETSISYENGLPNYMNVSHLTNKR